MSAVRPFPPAACLLVPLPSRSAPVWSAPPVVLSCRPSPCFPLSLCLSRPFAPFAPMQYGDSTLAP
ncbi:hypothetical protein GAC55_26210 [Bacteroides thetaiotaomicron]|nr:hypothetical protein GAC55_26210 [Bacteroides thetaiotaomicron]